MRAIAPAMRAWISHDATSAEGTPTGMETMPPRPVMNPVVKFFDISHLISAFTRCSLSV